MKKTKAQKKLIKEIKERKRQKAIMASEQKYHIEAINGIEIAYLHRTIEDIVTETKIQDLRNLSKIAIHQYNEQGRGGFLIISENNPNEAVYFNSEMLLNSIKNAIPEALDYVRKILNEYNAEEEFTVINVLNRKRIVITRDALRSDV